jgi:hypothetical protein
MKQKILKCLGLVICLHVLVADYSKLISFLLLITKTEAQSRIHLLVYNKC